MSEQRRAEGALASGDQRLGALIEQVPAIVYTAAFGEEGRWSFVSAQVERMLGWTPEEWMADPRAWIRRIHPDDRERVIEDEDPLQGPGDQLRSEYRMVARDGRVLWVRDAATVIVGEGGELLMQGLMLDVTDLKRAEGDALENEEKYRMLVETSQDLIWAIDLENRFTFVNDAVQTHLRLRARGDDRPAVHRLPEARDRPRATWRSRPTIPEGEIPQRYETEALRKDGMHGDPELQQRASCATARATSWAPPAPARDVTEQRRIEEAVAAKHLQLQSIIDNSPLVIYAKDAEHRYLIANRELRAACWGCRPGTRWAAPTTSCSARTRPPSAPARGPEGARLGHGLRGRGGAERRRPRARLPAAPLPAARGRRQRLRRLRDRHRHHRAPRARGHAAGEARVVGPDPAGDRRGPARAARPADRGDRERAAGCRRSC